MKPPVSIIIITCNEEKNISDCLDSLQNLDYPKFEVIIVDSSTDNTPNLVKDYSFVKLIKTKEKGFAVQRNLGIKNAKYDLIAFTDADCIIPKDWLNLLTSALDKDSVAVGGNAYSPMKSPYLGKCIACLGFPAGGDVGLDSINNLDDKGNINSIATCNALFRKSILTRLNGFNNSLKYGGEDSDLCKRISEKNKTIKYASASYVYHKTKNTLSEFVRWYSRRGEGKYYLSKGRYNLLVLPFMIIFSLFFIYLLFISFSIALGMILLLYLFNLFILMLTKKFIYLINRRKRVGINILSILLVIVPLELLKQMSISGGYILSFTKNAIRPRNKE